MPEPTDRQRNRLSRRGFAATLGGMALSTAAGATAFNLSSANQTPTPASDLPQDFTAPADCEVVTDPRHGADPTGAVDSTAAWQSAVDAAINGCGQVWAPPGNYLINGEIVVNGTVSIRGVYTSLRDSSVPHNGTRLFATNDSGAFMMRVQPPDIDSNPDAQIWGVALSDLTFDGAGIDEKYGPRSRSSV